MLRLFQLGFCFLLLPLLHYSVLAQTLHWVPAGERKTIDLSASLRTLDGAAASITEIQDKVILLNFWATWCGPCRQEMPEIAKLREQLADEALVVVALTNESPEEVRAYLERTPFPFRFLLDKDNTLVNQLRVPGFPSTLILDRQKRIALAYLGAYNWSEPQVVVELRRLAHEEAARAPPD